MRVLAEDFFGREWVEHRHELFDAVSSLLRRALRWFRRQ